MTALWQRIETARAAEVTLNSTRRQSVAAAVASYEVGLMPSYVPLIRAVAERGPATARVAQTNTSKTGHVPRAAPTNTPCAEAGTTATAVLLVPLRATPLAVGQAVPVLSVNSKPLGHEMVVVFVVTVLKMLRPQLLILGTALVKMVLQETLTAPHLLPPEVVNHVPTAGRAMQAPVAASALLARLSAWVAAPAL